MPQLNVTIVLGSNFQHLALFLFFSVSLQISKTNNFPAEWINGSSQATLPALPVLPICPCSPSASAAGRIPTEVYVGLKIIFLAAILWKKLDRKNSF